MANGRCIYPGPHEGPSREHYLPRGLGTFTGCEPLADRVCARCNRELGQLDEMLLRTGPTGFLRHLAGVTGRDGPGPSVFQRGVAGVPPVEMPGRLPGMRDDVLMEVDRGTRDAAPMSQIVFETPNGQRRAHRITGRMRGRPDLLLEELRQRGMGGAQPVDAIALTTEIPWVNDLLRVLGANPPDTWESLEVPPHQIQSAATVTAGEWYFRAVAKLAFHYALKMFPALTGEEHEFARIKEYVWAGTGGGRDRPVQQLPHQFWEKFRRGERPRCWMHILAVERAYKRALAVVQLFAGPGGLPYPYWIDLGRDPARIAAPREVRAHVFALERTDDGHDGVMEEARPNTYITSVGFTSAARGAR